MNPQFNFLIFSFFCQTQLNDSSAKQVAMKYLTEKVGLTLDQIGQLQEKLK